MCINKQTYKLNIQIKYNIFHVQSKVIFFKYWSDGNIVPYIQLSTFICMILQITMMASICSEVQSTDIVLI